MQHTYSITGMTCGGCQAKVAQSLQGLEGVQDVSVSLEAGEATIQMERHIDTARLRAALPSKYTLTEQASSRPSASVSSEEEAVPSKWRQLFPLLLILCYIAVAAVWLNVEAWSTSSFMYDFMGLFFIVFSFFKLLDLRGFPVSFRMYDPLARRVPAYATVYPFIETLLGLLFLTRTALPIALVVTLVLLSITTWGVARTLLQKRQIKCACLGTVLQLPMTEATLIENTIMLVMAVWMLTGLLV